MVYVVNSSLMIILQNLEKLQFNNDKSNELGELHQYKKETLIEIPLGVPIIDFNSDWNRETRIESHKTHNIGRIRAESIGSMESTKPAQLPEVKYALEATYNWEVEPPIKPSGSNKSKIYSEYDKLQSELSDKIVYLSNSINSVENEKHRLVNIFAGAKQKAKKQKNILAEFESLELPKLKYNEMTDLLDKFKTFYNDVLKNRNDLKVGIRKEEAREKWEKEKEIFEKKLADEKKQLEQFHIKVEESNKLKNKINENIKKIKQFEDKIKEIHNTENTIRKDEEILGIRKIYERS